MQCTRTISETQIEMSARNRFTLQPMHAVQSLTCSARSTVKEACGGAHGSHDAHTLHSAEHTVHNLTWSARNTVKDVKKPVEVPKVWHVEA